MVALYWAKVRIIQFLSRPEMTKAMTISKNGPLGSVTVAPKTTASEVQHDKYRHDHTDDGEGDLES